MIVKTPKSKAKKKQVISISKILFAIQSNWLLVIGYWLVETNRI
jgi:hypothetical protein